MHVLVLSNNVLATAALSHILKAAGFIPAILKQGYHLVAHSPAPEAEHRGPNAESRSANATPAAIVLDCDRPTGHGECPVRQLRALGYRLPILVLAARHSPAAEVQYFENGADDYIAKPYAVPVLVARLR